MGRVASVTLTLTKQELIDAVTPVAAVVPQRTPLEQLQNIEIEARLSSLVVRGTNGQTWVETRTDVGGDIARLALPCVLFYAVINSLPDGSVTLKSDGKRLTLTTESSTDHLPIIPDDTYSRVHKFEEAPGFKIKGSMMKTGLRKVDFAVGTQASDVRWHGVLLKCTPEYLCFVAGDGKCVAAYTVKGDTKIKKTLEAIVPFAAIKLAAKSFPEGEKVSIEIGTDHVSFVTDGLTIASVLINGPYPPYDAVMEKCRGMIATTATIPSAEALFAIKRKAPYVDEYGITTLSFEKDMLHVKAEMKGADSTDSLVVGFEGDHTTVHFPIKQLIGSIEGAGTEKFTLGISTNAREGVFDQVNTEKKSAIETVFTAFLAGLKVQEKKDAPATT